MGSLKDEKNSLREVQLACEKGGDGASSVGSKDGATAEGYPQQASQKATSCEEFQPKLQMDASLTSIDLILDNSEQVQDCDMPLTQNTVSISLLDDADIKEETKSTSEILIPVPSTPDPLDPRSPAPPGQQHMRTQVSLEVVQRNSVATSPMTPPEGDQSFFFPSSFGKHETVAATATDTKDVELQVGQLVEFCSVATSPMTPKTPSSTAFPMLVGKDTVRNKNEVENSKMLEKSGQQESPGKPDPLKCDSYTEVSDGLSSLSHGSTQIIHDDSVQHCKQQRMGSMDQDITILVTHHGNNGNEGEEPIESHLKSMETNMVEIKENGQEEENKVVKELESKILNTNWPQKQPEESVSTNVTEDKGLRDLRDVSVPKSPIPESPAPFGCHNIRTQVSLEVVQCQSVATSPMTPPDGDHAFFFPSSLVKCDVEMQVGPQVEFRSVATAPITPRTPVATTFPEIKKEASVEGKIMEEEEEKKEQVLEDKAKDENYERENKEATNCTETEEEKCEEPVQEVTWDEKGMTWEVYGAVVEVAVLGSAIQKHLEKQVQKQKQQPSAPVPLNASSSVLVSKPGNGGSCKSRARIKREQEGKVGRRRRNPFRSLMENVQQPQCCSRAHTTE